VLDSSTSSVLCRPQRLLLLGLVLAGHGMALGYFIYHWQEGGSDLAPGVLQVSWVEAEKPAPPAEPEPAPEPRPLPMKAKPVPMARKQPRPKPKRLLSVAEQAPSPANDSLAPQSQDSDPVDPALAALAPQGPQAASAQQAGEAPAAVPPSFEADYLSNPAPAYPPESRALHEYGLVTLRIRVTVDGRPAEVQLFKSSGYPRLDKAAIDAVWQWQFVPARQSGTAVTGWVVVPIRFILRS